MDKESIATIRNEILCLEDKIADFRKLIANDHKHDSYDGTPIISVGDASWFIDDIEDFIKCLKSELGDKNPQSK